MWGPVGGTLIAIALIVGLFFLLSRPQASGTVPQRPLASSSVMQSVTHIDPSVFAAVGGGSTTPPSAVSGHPALTGSGGKPLLFYDGAEYCPYCAAERWAVVVALSRFGTWGTLHETTSSASDVYPSTNTFSFYQSTYQSTFIDFLPLEETTNQPDSSGGYVPLQSPTTQEQQLLSTFNPPGIPFIDIANKYTVTTPGYSPQVLQGLSWDDIAATLSNSSSPVSQGIVGTANYLTAAICDVTNQQPASVCTAAPIPQLEQSLQGTGASNTIPHAALTSASHALDPVAVAESQKRSPM